MHHEVRQATYADLVHIGENLKDDDKAELQAIGARPSDIAKHVSLSHEVHAWGPEGSPIAIFGVTPREPQHGTVWSLSTPEVLQRWREFHRVTPAILDYLGRDYLTLSNIKDARNTQQIRWLRSLGFTFIGSFNIGGHPFHEFVRIQK